MTRVRRESEDGRAKCRYRGLMERKSAKAKEGAKDYED